MCPPDRFGDGRTSESGGGVGVSFLNILATWWYIMSVFVRVQVGAGMKVLYVAAFVFMRCTVLVFDVHVMNVSFFYVDGLPQRR